MTTTPASIASWRWKTDLKVNGPLDGWPAFYALAGSAARLRGAPSSSHERNQRIGSDVVSASICVTRPDTQRATVQQHC